MRYFLVVGEASGDLHGANLIKAIKEQDPQASFAFMGGDKMEESSQTSPIVHYKDVAVMGFFNVLKNIFEIKKSAKKIQKALLNFSPDVIIPIDFSGFTIKYILPFSRKNIPSASIHYYIPPKVWAWRKNRANKLKKYCNSIFCILPFEVDFFKQLGLNAIYVGNPCVDAVGDFFNSNNYSSTKNNKRITILAGSRKQEVKENLPIMLRTLRKNFPDYTIAIAGAPGLTLEDYKPFLPTKEKTPILFNKTYELLKNSSIALVTSGTATLETALIGCPQVVCYRTSGKKIINWIFKNLFPIKYFSLVNLILDHLLVPELLSANLTEEKLTEEIKKILNNPHYMIEGYKNIRHKLSQESAAKNTAYHIISLSKNN